MVALVVVGPLAEQRATDPDDRGALLDGHLEVVAHPHRQRGAEARVRRRAARPRGSAASGRSGARPPATSTSAPDRHQAVDAAGSAGPGSPAGPRATAGGAKPALAGSSATLTWSRTGSGLPGRRSPAEPVEPPGEVERVDRLDDVEQLDGAPGLVRLERPDEVPRRAVGRGHLGGRLLDAVLPEDREAGVDRRLDAVRLDGLGHRDQVTAAGSRPARAAARAIRSRTRSRAAASSATAVSVIGRRSATGDGPAPRGYRRRRKLGISRSSAS